MNLLIADHDPLSVKVLCYLLEETGYHVFKAHDGAGALELFRAAPIDMIVLDVDLPVGGGYDVCANIRCASSVPIIFLSSRPHLGECVNCLQIGGDDYVAKPVEPAELLARIEAILRRVYGDPSGVTFPLSRGNLTLNPITSCALMADNRSIALTQMEFRLLHYLMKNVGCAFNASQLLQHVWGDDSASAGRVVVAYIHRLREKIEPDPEHPTYIVTVRHLGYRFETQHDAVVSTPRLTL